MDGERSWQINNLFPCPLVNSSTCLLVNSPTNKEMKRLLPFCILLLSLWFCPLLADEQDSLISRITRYAEIVDNFSRQLPQENVYLQLDNTSYRQGDPVYFSCYVVTSQGLSASKLSKTLYVELLNPGGETVATCVLKINNGRCHGSFRLDRLPFYSGFYEIRAYTKYMLNFGGDVIFSRLFPVFDLPKTEGDFTEKKMDSRAAAVRYPMKREKAKKAKKLNVRFYPEGGNLVNGVTSNVAFEVTDAYGQPVHAEGVVKDSRDSLLCRFAVTREGRGVFAYTPPADGKAEATVTDGEGRQSTFQLPEAQETGVVMTVDNLSSADSIRIVLQQGRHTPPQLCGVAVLNRGNVEECYVAPLMYRKPRKEFKIDKRGFSAGVSRVVLFDATGKVMADRLIFLPEKNLLRISAHPDREEYEPLAPVKVDIAVADAAGNPVQTAFSLSVRDSRGEVDWHRNVLTDLLLMSEIKGYVHRPDYYFESDDEAHRQALDQLLMVQGWRRYSWEQMSGREPFELKYLPEQGIEVHGQVVSFVRGKPKGGVAVSSFLSRRGREDDEEADVLMNLFTADSLGRFAFVSDTLSGKWNMILSVAEKGKRKDYRILLDRLFSPAPRPYAYPELRVEQGDGNGSTEALSPAGELNPDSLYAAWDDSTGTDMTQRIHRLKEVTVKSEKGSPGEDIYYSRSTAVAYYDVPSELDDLKDRGEFVGEDINELLCKLNPKFFLRRGKEREYLNYGGKVPMFVINYEEAPYDTLDYFYYQLVRLGAIKAIYVSEDIRGMCTYADSRMSPIDVMEKYGCAVFIETYPEGKIPVDGGKGVRKTWLEGYSIPEEFYSPDYSTLPPAPDYRRTLYWNPEVTTDDKGQATVRFYNNTGCRRPHISVETVTADGRIGVFTSENTE